MLFCSIIKLTDFHHSTAFDFSCHVELEDLTWKVICIYRDTFFDQDAGEFILHRLNDLKSLYTGIISIYRELSCIQSFFLEATFLGWYSTENNNLILTWCKDARANPSFHLLTRVVDYRPAFFFLLVVDPLYRFQVVLETHESTEHVEVAFEAAAPVQGSFASHIWQLGPLVDQCVKNFSCSCHDRFWFFSSNVRNSSTHKQRLPVGAKWMFYPWV